MPATWFKLLATELESLSENDLSGPLLAELEEKDHVVGDITSDLDLQKFYVLGRRLIAESERLLIDAREAGSRKEMEELVSRAQELTDKGHLIVNIFWTLIKDSFQLWDKSSIGIREGWQVVWSDQNSSLPPFLRGLFGGSL